MRSRGWEELLEFLSTKTRGGERRAGERGGGTQPISSPPPHACWPEQISVRWTTGSLVSQLEQRRRRTRPRAAWANRGHLFCVPQWLSVSGTNSKEPNNKRHFQPRQRQKQSSAALDWRRRQWWRGGGRWVGGGNNRGSRTEALIPELKRTKGGAFATERSLTSRYSWPRWHSPEHQRRGWPDSPCLKAV